MNKKRKSVHYVRLTGYDHFSYPFQVARVCRFASGPTYVAEFTDKEHATEFGMSLAIELDVPFEDET